MGPLLMAGLTAFGATIAIGIVASRCPPARAASAAPPTPRSLAIVVMAFAMGIGVLGVVTALLGVELGLEADQVVPAAAVGPALLGGLVGVAIVFRDGGEADRSVVAIGTSFIASSVLLTGIVAILAVVLREAVGVAPPTWQFATLGAVAAAATIGIGVVGGAGVRAMDAALPDEARMVMSRQIARIVPFEAIAVAASAAAILLVVLTGP